MPLLARIYPNGKADVNHFHAAGGMGYVIGELLDAGLLHGDVTTVAGEGGLRRYRAGTVSRRRQARVARLRRKSAAMPACSRRPRRRSAPTAGLKLLDGNLGRAVIKTSAVKPEHRVVQAPAIVFDIQER